MEQYLDESKNTNINLVLQDSKGDPQTALSALNQEIVRSSPEIIISAFSNVSGAVIPKAEQEGIFTILTATSSDKIMMGHNLVQRINPSVRDIDDPILKYAKDSDLRKIAIMYSNEEWGISSKDYFTNEFSDSIRSVISTEGYAIVEKDVKTLVQKIIQTNPDGIFVTGYGPAYGSIFGALKSYKYQGQILADVGLAIPTIMASVGEAAEGVVFSGTELELTYPRNEVVKEFSEMYQEEYDRSPLYLAAFSYDILKIIDYFNDKGMEISQENMNNLKSWDSLIGKIEFLPNGECKIPMIAIQRRGSENVPAEK